MFLLPILLTSRFSPVVTPQQPIKKGERLATGKDFSATTINIAQALNIPVHKVRGHVKKRPGEAISRGEVLAVKSSGLGFNKERIISEVDGVIHDISVDTGDIIIHSPLQQILTLISPVDGIITVCDNEKIVIQTATPVMAAEEGVGHNGRGQLHGLTQTSADEVQYYQLDSNARGKILLGGKFGREVLVKAIGLQAAGILTTSIAPQDLEYIEKKYMFPILRISESDYANFMQILGRELYIDGLSRSIVL